MRGHDDILQLGEYWGSYAVLMVDSPSLLVGEPA
jgi:hypothetical protein